MKLEEWKATGTYFQFRQHRIFYQEAGSGKVLLLLHGFPTASWDWYKVWPELTRRYRVIAPDLIGFGFSSKPWPYQYTFREQAEMVGALLSSLGIDKAHILAHDYGDSVAQELLALKQEQKAGLFAIHNICFLNGGLFMEATKPNKVQRLLLTPLGPLVARFFTKGKLKKNFDTIFGPECPPSDEEIDVFWTLINNNNGRRVIPGLIRYIRERKVQRDHWLQAMRNTKVPLRLIIGTADPISGRSIADRYRELIPDPDIVLLEGVGHYPQVEAVEKVLDHYLEFNQK